MSTFFVAPNQMRAVTCYSTSTPFFRRSCRQVLMYLPNLGLTLSRAVGVLPGCVTGRNDASLLGEAVLRYWRGENLGQAGALTCDLRCNLAGSVASRPILDCSPACLVLAAHSLPRLVGYAAQVSSTCLVPCFARGSGISPPCSVFLLHAPYCASPLLRL